MEHVLQCTGIKFRHILTKKKKEKSDQLFWENLDFNSLTS